MSATVKRALGLCIVLLLAAVLLLATALHTNIPREAAPIRTLISSADKMSFAAMSKVMDTVSVSMLTALGGPQTKEDFFGLCGISINSTLGTPQHLDLVSISRKPTAEDTYHAVVSVQYQDEDGQKQTIYTSVEYVLADGRVLC